MIAKDKLTIEAMLANLAVTEEDSAAASCILGCTCTSVNFDHVDEVIGEEVTLSDFLEAIESNGRADPDGSTLQPLAMSGSTHE